LSQLNLDPVAAVRGFRNDSKFFAMRQDQKTVLGTSVFARQSS
jgi:hypothetical protein